MPVRPQPAAESRWNDYEPASFAMRVSSWPDSAGQRRVGVLGSQACLRADAVAGFFPVSIEWSAGRRRLSAGQRLRQVSRAFACFSQGFRPG